MSENVFKKARLEAAKRDKRFLKPTTTAGYMLSTISRDRLYKIELDDSNPNQIIPNVDDVYEMAEVYDAPELRDYYCTKICPIGRKREPLMYENLGEISAQLMSSIHFLEKISDDIHRILADSKVTDDEKKEFLAIIDTLGQLAFSSESIKLWAEKNGYID